MPKPTEADRERFTALVPEAPDVVVKPMFGNLGAFVNGNMFMGLFGSDVGVKLAAARAGGAARPARRRAVRAGRAADGRLRDPARGLVSRRRPRRGSSGRWPTWPRCRRRNPRRRRDAGVPAGHGRLPGRPARAQLAGVVRREPGALRAGLVAPAKAFVTAAAPLLDRLAPGITAEPRVLGSIFRINRDTRFSPDKRPYKDHLDLWFWHGRRATAVSGLFLRLTPDEFAVGAGAHDLQKEHPRAVPHGGRRPGGRPRAGRHHRRLDRAGIGVAGRSMKRPPAGYHGRTGGGAAAPAPSAVHRRPRAERRRHRRRPGRAARAPVGTARPAAPVAGRARATGLNGGRRALPARCRRD